MNPTFGELPADVRRSIMDYLSLTEVIRFGSTCKNMHNFSWPCCQEISVSREHPIEAHFWVLSQDLSQARDISFYYSRDSEYFTKEKHRIPDLIKKLSGLAKLTNLHALSIDLSLPDEDIKRQANNAIKNIVTSLTQLQDITWCSADVVDFNVGELLSAHKRLKQFATHSKQKIYGVEKLTQVQILSLSFCEQFDDQTFSAACQLPQLKSFATYYNDNITDVGFAKITNLTNLEKFSLNHAPGMKSASFGLLAKLPKLSDLTVNYPWDNEQQEYSATLAIIGQLSHLTSLQISNYEGKVDFGTLTNLTDLLDLDIDSCVESADFLPLSKLTRLVFRPKADFQFTNLPPNLRRLEISSFKLNNDAIYTIGNMEHLVDLQFSHNDFDTVEMSNAISKLTKLNTLTIIPHPPIELFPALRALPNLVSLTFSEVPTESIWELSMLTQVMELVYWSHYKKDLRDMLPFLVTYVGDLSESEEADEDETLFS